MNENPIHNVQYVRQLPQQSAADPEALHPHLEAVKLAFPNQILRDRLSQLAHVNEGW